MLGNSALRHGLIASLVCMVAMELTATRADEGAVKPASVIHLVNGDHIEGRLAESQSDGIVWQSPAFAKPFDFPVSVVNTIQFPIPATLPQPVGEFCFELAGGDLVFGTLTKLEGNEAVIDVAGLGPLHLDRTLLRRMYRWKEGAELIYFGPTGLNGWQITGVADGWQEESGNLISTQSGATIRRDFGLPPLARIEFELSWKTKADFELALGVGDAKSVQRAFRFEVWDNEVVIQRETEREADVANLQTCGVEGGRAHLQAFLDQTKGRILVLSSSGKPLADMTVPTTKPQVLGGIQLTNKTGDVRLERLSIGRWNGEAPRAVESDKSRIHSVDGSITYGQFKSYDTATGQFVIEGSAEQRIAGNQVQDVFFSQGGEVSPRSLRAIQSNGQRFSGSIARIGKDAIHLTCPGIREPIAIPIASLQALTGLSPSEVPATATPAEARTGKLELTGVLLHGRLVETKLVDDPCLDWQPSLSRTSSPLRHGVAGRIVYREPSPKPKTQPATTATRVLIQNGAVITETHSADNTTTSSPKGKRKNPVLHLRSGDTIPCNVASADENGVTFSSPITDAKFVRHDQLKVLELVPDASPVQIEAQKKERLLMLPRMQRDNPPTHLVRSIDGDYLRGRMVSMDEHQLQIEIRLDVKTLHRDRVARIIWLHADEVDGAAKPPANDAAATGTRVQALADGSQGRVPVKNATSHVNKALSAMTNVSFTDNPLEEALGYLENLHHIEIEIDEAALAEVGVATDHKITLVMNGIALRSALHLILDPLKLGFVVEGETLKITSAAKSRPAEMSSGNNRLTFFAEQLDGSILSGKSDLLGACRVDLRQIDQLLIGAAIERDAATLAFHQWKLKAAPEPMVPSEGGGDDSDGRDAALVGKPAPEIELDMLDGSRFQLSKMQNKVIILDFWASWCGPCLQVMPQVDKVAAEFADQGVELVAVNLEEKEERIQAALDRLKIKVPVALDRNGRIAEKYGASAIPQTVIVDRTGKVARLFVGGGPRFGEQLRTALQAVLGDAGNKPAVEKPAADQ